MLMDIITVFTPTYNRAYTLTNLYTSLQKQSDKRFEWLIVDDGSDDDTEDVVRGFFNNDSGFPVRYYKKENGGKHTAINMGVELANGFLFFIVDSDDELTFDAIEKLFLWESTIRDKNGFAGISGNKGYKDGNLHGETFVGDFVDATALERNAFHIIGDKSEAYYTNVLRNYPFPVITGEKFVDECIVWNRIGADGLKIRWFNDIIYLVEQRNDGLIAQGNKRFSKSPKGYAIEIIENAKYYNYSHKQKLLAAYYYYEVVKADVSMRQAASLLHMNSVVFVLFWIWQSFKIKVKGLTKL